MLRPLQKVFRNPEKATPHRSWCIAFVQLYILLEPRIAKWKITTTDEPKREDTGPAMVLVERFKQWTLPRALDIKAKSDPGEKLADFDINFFENVLKDAQETNPHVAGTPEDQSLYARTISRYGQITKRNGL